MQALNLLSVKIEKINFSNNVIVPEVNGSIDIQIETDVSSTVNYDVERKQCKCATTFKLAPKETSVDFGVEICVSGLFACGEIEDRKKTHVEVCKMLFPHVQSRVISFLTMVGIPNFVFEAPRFDIADVQISE